MRCLDYDQAVGLVQFHQPRVLHDVAELEDIQMALEAAASWLRDEDAVRVQAATRQLRTAIWSLREAETALGEVNEAMRVRAS